MSVGEIIHELPRLSHDDRRDIRRHLVELEEADEDILLGDLAAQDGAMMLDAMEEEDEQRQAR